MSAACCGPKPDPANSPTWRAVLWVALIVNAAMFGVELYAGAAANSQALKADALDFFGDAANYAISLVVAGRALTWRARAALFKGSTIAVLGVFVLVSTVSSALTGSSPEPQTMGVIGVLALAANLVVALMLFQFRSGDACDQSGFARATTPSAT